jgi:hypothetical protein
MQSIFSFEVSLHKLLVLNFLFLQHFLLPHKSSFSLLPTHHFLSFLVKIHRLTIIWDFPCIFIRLWWIKTIGRAAKQDRMIIGLAGGKSTKIRPCSTSVSFSTSPHQN